MNCVLIFGKVGHSIIILCHSLWTLGMLLTLTFFWQWIHEEFLAYLDKWEKSVKERPGNSKSQKKRIMLSPETLLGLKITGTL